MFAEHHHMGHIIMECFKQRADHLCQIDAATGEQETNISVLRRCIHIARCLRKIGMVPGDVMVVSGRNHMDMHIPYYAGMFTGLPLCGIDPMCKLDEIKEISKVIEPKIVFCEPESYDDYVRASRDLGLDTKVFTFGKGEHSMQNLADTYKDDTPIEEFEITNFDTDKIYGFLICTGGTTGNVKVAAIKHDAWKRKMSGMVVSSLFRTRQLSSEELSYKPALNMASIQWVSGPLVAIGMPLLQQTKISYSAPATIETVIDVINKYKPVSVIFNTALAAGILKSEKPCDLSCFKTITVGGTKALKETMIALKEKAGKNTLIAEVYGLTENLVPLFAPNPFGPIGSCGVPIPGTTTKLVDPKTGETITEPNVTGELWIKDLAFTEYYKNPEETAAVYTEDGWFKTGDLLYRDENNNYFYVERLKMLIKYRDVQVIPTELEAVISTLDGVMQVVVTSIPHHDDGEHPVACVVRRPGAKVTAQEIKDIVATKLSHVKHLRGGVVFMDKLPLAPTGKVARSKLRKLVTTMKRE